MYWLTLRVDIFEILRLSQALVECKISEKSKSTLWHSLTGL